MDEHAVLPPIGLKCVLLMMLIECYCIVALNFCRV